MIYRGHTIEFANQQTLRGACVVTTPQGVKLHKDFPEGEDEALSYVDDLKRAEAKQHTN